MELENYKTKTEIAKELKITRRTLYNYLRKNKDE